MHIRVYATPGCIRPGDLCGATAVVIDALRMTSVAAAAVANGCAGLCTAVDIDEARELASRHGALLGGERNALQIDGFDFSNSPSAYTRGRVGGRRLVMTTTNGTRAIDAAGAAEKLLLGAFVNARAVAESARGAENVALVCAGTHGLFSLEDALAAGAIIDRLRRIGVSFQPDDMAIATRTLYATAGGDLHTALRETTHYNRLVGLGLKDDLDFCLREDTVDAVPERGADGWFR